MVVRPEVIFSDMDEVLAAFVWASCEAHGRPREDAQQWSYFKDWDITGEEFWVGIHAHGDRFYGEMVKPFSWTNQLVGVYETSGIPWELVSSPGICAPVDYTGKKIWTEKYLNGKRPYVMHDKKYLAAPGRLLIDDGDHNIDVFKERGGSTILFPAHWNRSKDKVEHKIELVLDAIQIFIKTGVVNA